jgi:phospholipase/lecithinase/hemolysin
MLFRVGLIVISAALAATGAPFTSLYFFGDSVTDTGNVLKGTTALNRYTFGLVPRTPVAPYRAGRFSDGPVWAEHTAARLGHPGDAAHAGMSMGWFGQVGGPGNNYAIGGARTGSGGALGFFDFAIPTGMATQVDFYLSRTGGVADPDGLYFMFGGGNDLRDAARISDPSLRMLAAQGAGANIAFSVRDLYLAGARQFAFVNSADVGLIPETIGDGLSAEGTDATLHFNTYLGLYGDYLRYWVPDFTLYYFDLFSLHHELIAQYGMGAVRPCKSEPAGTCEQTLFFDSIHPSAWVHEIIGNRIADQILLESSQDFYLSSAATIHNPEPSTAVLTLSAVAALLVARRRRQRT